MDTTMTEIYQNLRHDIGFETLFASQFSVAKSSNRLKNKAIFFQKTHRRRKWRRNPVKIYKSKKYYLFVYIFTFSMVYLYMCYETLRRCDGV
jgi:hypothetical protein